MNNKIVVLAGFSASGKDRIADSLESDGLHLIKSVTSRPIRANESEGNPYYFTSNKDFLKLIQENKLIEYRKYNTLVDKKPAIWYYGVTKGEVPEDKASIVVLDIGGLQAFKNEFGDRVVSIFISVADEIRKTRCQERGDYNEIEFNRRLQDDNEKFPKEVLDQCIDYYLCNENSFAETLLDLDCIIEEIENAK